MSRIPRFGFSCLTALVLAACTDRTVLERQAGEAATNQLTGTWDAYFHLDRPPLLTLTINPEMKDVSGEFAFVPNRWVVQPYPEMPAPSAYGTYDVDFTPFGFDPRRTDETPTAVAGWVKKDSLQIILGEPNDETSVILDGRMTNDSIRGSWTVSIGRSGGGGGSFLIVRRR